MMASAAPSSGETTPARAPPGCPAHHPLDDTFDDGAHISNIESFVVSTVPLVPALDAERPAGDGEAHPSRDGAAGPSRDGADRFALRDLWGSFDEWSAYGVEVPLTLDDEEHEVFQYYVPFLSGIQVFKRAEARAPDGAATSRETRDDDDRRERERERENDDDDDATGATGAPGASRRQEDDRENDRIDDAKGPAGGRGFLPLPSGIDAATRAGETVPGRELVLQYFEQASPYARAPLADTAEKLRVDHPELFDLTSDELHPASWMSVAWYPIYRIPVGRSLRDLSACFLTYHALSAGARGGDGDGDEASPVPPHARGCPAPPPASATGEAAMAARANRLIGSDPAGRSRVRLRAFGLAYYKLRAELWRPAEVADWLKTMQGGARAWLRGQKVIHPDFEFFSHRG